MTGNEPSDETATGVEVWRLLEMSMLPQGGGGRLLNVIYCWVYFDAESRSDTQLFQFTGIEYGGNQWAK